MTSTMNGAESQTAVRAGTAAPHVREHNVREHSVQEQNGPAQAVREHSVREHSGPARAHTQVAAKSPGQPPPRFLEGKLQVPQSHFPVLRRRRITALLDQAARNRVTLISGPAGAGKTVAASTWAAAPGQARRVVWVTLDAEDQQSWFWAYVCAGLSRLRSIPAETLRSLEDVSPDGFPLRLVEAAQTFTEPVILVLDDIHELTDPTVLGGIDLLIRHAPPTLRLVLSARQPPALQLARLRVAGELADIGGHDLACTSEEADAYFSMLGLDVDPGARDALLRRTQGWMAGLRLAAMAARSDPEPGATITDLAGDEPIVTDYLWDEVLVKQAPATRMFLLRTCIAAQVSGDLADALTGQSGSARTLDRLSRENSFVDVVDRERGEYAYHPLLRQVLTAELHREIPHEIPVLLRRAARWYAAHDHPIASVRCAAEAQDWDYAAQTLAEAGAGVASPGSTADLESVLSLFPADRSSDDPAVAAAWAAARLWDGDRDGAVAYLDSGDRALARAVPAMARIMEPTLAALRVMLAGGRTDPDPALLATARSLAERAQAAASTQPEHRAVGLLWFALGVARLRRWEIQPARHALRLADRQLAAGNLTGLQARARAWRALAEAWYGDLTAARRSAADGLTRRGPLQSASAGPDRPELGRPELGRPEPGRPELNQAAELAGLAQALLSLRRDDLSTAQRLLEGIDPQLTGQFPGEPPVSAVAALIRARVLLADGDATGATALLSRLRETWGPAHPALADVLTIAEGEVALRVGNTGRARAVLLLVEEGEHFDRADGRLLRGGLLIAEGDFKSALEAVEPCLDGDDGVTLQEQISGLLIAAAAQRRLGLADEAAGLLEQALTLAEPEGAYRAFLDAGAAVRSAMTVLIAPTSRHAGFAGRILERFDAQAPRPSGPADGASVPLTDSERAVLRFLPSHMTNEEISQALFLSINTVKTHLRSAYRKLGVSSRREAIARGRRLGLL
ncbi:MAG TPA: LuxR C-terminal-related transcriptional regulator [Streptosporangiaceae bacterium]|nr:LuxR C-terminal-related transcriptional regulator [Streptosporangiaceae bacterium]